MLQDVHKATELINTLQLDEDWSEGVIEDSAEGVHEGRQSTTLAVSLGEEVLKQLMLHLAHLHSRNSPVTTPDISPIRSVKPQ